MLDISFDAILLQMKPAYTAGAWRENSDLVFTSVLSNLIRGGQVGPSVHMRLEWLPVIGSDFLALRADTHLPHCGKQPQRPIHKQRSICMYNICRINKAAHIVNNLL